MYPQVITLPYHPTAVLDYFTIFASEPWSMLLHSGDSNHPDSRYDILVAYPVITLVTRDGITEISHGNNREWSDTDPFSLVQQQLSLANMIAVPNDELPFQCGALGFFGYDLARSIENLPVLAKQDVSLPDMAIGIYRWTVIADHLRNTVILISYDDPHPILNKLSVTTLPNTVPFHLLDQWHNNMTRTEYGEKFRQVQQYLLSGDCYQVCLSHRFSAPCYGDEWPAFRLLLAHNRAPFSAFIRLADKAVLSLSPERFLRLRSKEIQTRPIKGTLPRLIDDNDDLQQIARLSMSAKDKAENLMIVDLLRNDIGKIAKPGTVRVQSLFSIETFTAVHHMVSTISAILPADRTPCDLLRACFPGGSITGAPKVRAMEIIEQIEPQRRSVWCGSIGYISCCGAMDTNIAIRTLLVADQHIYCYVGGGIVADSNEEDEYQETLDKVSSILPMLEQL